MHGADQAILGTGYGISWNKQAILGYKGNHAIFPYTPMNVQGLSRGFYNSWALGQAVTRYALKKYWGRQMCNLSE